MAVIRGGCFRWWWIYFVLLVNNQLILVLLTQRYMNKCPVRRLIFERGKGKESLVMKEMWNEPHVCRKCVQSINWHKFLIKTAVKIVISGLIKALLTHIVLSHMKK